MRKNLKNVMLLVLVIASMKSMNAQVDPHFTQYYVYPSWLNPALTGIFDGDVRVSGIYRSQWGNITSPFSTTGVSLDFNSSKNMNFGVSALQQKAGNGGYTYTTAYGSFSYTGVKFGKNDYNRMAFGLPGMAMCVWSSIHCNLERSRESIMAPTGKSDGGGCRAATRQRASNAGMGFAASIT